MQKAGQLVEVGDELDKLGKADDILPAAKSTIESIYDGKELRPADRVQHRRHLVQQEDLRRQRHRGPDHVGRPDRRSRQAEVRRRRAVRRRRQGRLAGHASRRQLHLPYRRTRRDAEGRRRRRQADRPRVRGRRQGDRRPGRRGRLRQVGRLHRLHDRHERVPLGQGGHVLHGQLGARELQRPGAGQDRCRQHRLHAVPRRRWWRRLLEPARGERRNPARDVEAEVRRRSQGAGSAASPTTTAPSRSRTRVS